MRHVLTILAVDDLARMARFYEDALDRAAVVRTPSYVEIELAADRRLGLYDAAGFVKNTGVVAGPAAAASTTSRTELYFSVDDLASAVRRLEAAGAALLSPRALRPWGDEAAYFADPERNVVVVAVIAQPSGAGAAKVPS